MNVSYKKLWKILIDKDMKKKDLREATGMSTTSLAKLSKNENINTEILVKICKVLECDIGDIMEVIDDEPLSNQTDKENPTDGTTSI